MLMPTPAMPRRPRPLPPAPAIIPAAGFRPARVTLLTRGPEQDPAQRHHPLLQRGDLLPLHGHRPGQRRVLRRQPRILRRQRLRPPTPEHRLISGGTRANRRDHHAKTAPLTGLCPAPPHRRVASPPTGSPNTYARPV